MVPPAMLMLAAACALPAFGIASLTVRRPAISH
jgi:hypothetical protein